MSAEYDFDVVVIGAGPAGSAAAIRLLRYRRELAGRILLLDKETFPRPKLCAGGVTRRAEAALETLGSAMPATSVGVRSVEFRFRDGEHTIRAKNPPGYVFRVVQRASFDHGLALDAASRGVVFHDGERVTSVTVTADAITIGTDRHDYRARVAISADGANSFVRRFLGLTHPPCVGVARETLIRADRARADRDGNVTHAVFDFTPTVHGLQGYYWEFPALGGPSMMSAGVFDSRMFAKHPGRNVVTELRERCAARADAQLATHSAKGAPMRWYHPRARQSAHRVVFAGDAAGAEPLLGEGISSALEFGIHAADAVLRALAGSDYSFVEYDRTLAHTNLGRALVVKLGLARSFYARLGTGV